MMKLKFILIFFLTSFILINAQDSILKKIITQKYNFNNIKKLQTHLKRKEKIDSINITKFIERHKINKENASGIEGITQNGIPIKINTHSLNQITATNTNLVKNNSVSGFNLTGNGITAHIFDDGAILSTHTEFDNRVSNYKSNNILKDDHPTLVAGVMAAKGKSLIAEGMATKLTIVGENYKANRLSRMNEVAKSGVLISNHSYGFLAGWDFSSGSWRWWGDDSISKSEDFSFGYYGNNDEINDQITLVSPYHLQVKSSANNNGEGGSGPEDGVAYYLNSTNVVLNTRTTPRSRSCESGFDCIPTGNVSKNILVVGAVDPLLNPNISSNIKLSNFSSVGPTDDGRIKPDLVAVGSQVNMPSAESNTLYSLESGTSFSSPSVAGIAALLQEQFFGLKGEYMRSDLVKALLINTTNEAGNAAGPDYKFGWGLVDTYKAAMIIKNNKNTTFLNQFTLSQASSCSMQIKAVAGSKVKVTLAWIDKEYTAYRPSLNNRTKTLVNDLDLRVYQKNNPSAIQLPWKLDVNNPNAAATKGDNNTDNVEQVEFIPNLTTDYIVEVKHKGNLVNPTKYSIVVNAKANTFCEEKLEENLSLYYLDENRLYVKFPLNKQVDGYEFFIYDYTGKLLIQSTEVSYQIFLKKFNLSPGNYIALAKSLGKATSVKFSVN